MSWRNALLHEDVALATFLVLPALVLHCSHVPASISVCWQNWTYWHFSAAGYSNCKDATGLATAENWAVENAPKHWMSETYGFLLQVGVLCMFCWHTVVMAMTVMRYRVVTLATKFVNLWTPNSQYQNRHWNEQEPLSAQVSVLGPIVPFNKKC